MMFAVSRSRSQLQALRFEKVLQHKCHCRSSGCLRHAVDETDVVVDICAGVCIGTGVGISIVRVTRTFVLLLEVCVCVIVNV
jgi:hypothetical protein